MQDFLARVLLIHQRLLVSLRRRLLQLLGVVLRLTMMLWVIVSPFCGPR